MEPYMGIKETLLLSVALENNDPYESILLKLFCHIRLFYVCHIHTLPPTMYLFRAECKTVLKDKYDCLTPTSKLA